jgi:hypothetical protein
MRTSYGPDDVVDVDPWMVITDVHFKKPKPPPLEPVERMFWFAEICGGLANPSLTLNFEAGKDPFAPDTPDPSFSVSGGPSASHKDKDNPNGGLVVSPGRTVIVRGQRIKYTFPFKIHYVVGDGVGHPAEIQFFMAFGLAPPGIPIGDDRDELSIGCSHKIDADHPLTAADLKITAEDGSVFMPEGTTIFASTRAGFTGGSGVAEPPSQLPGEV